MMGHLYYYIEKLCVDNYETTCLEKGVSGMTSQKSLMEIGFNYGPRIIPQMRTVRI